MGFLVSQKRRGFTLVEVLFVVAIIVLLSSVVIVNISTAKAKGRDTQRESDIEQLQLALRIYKDAGGAYPGATSTSQYDDGVLIGEGGALDTALQGYLAGTIRDPLGRGEYQYYYDSDYACNTGESHVVLVAQTMERSVSANYSSTCNDSEALVTGVTPGENSYIVLLKKNAP